MAGRETAALPGSRGARTLGGMHGNTILFAWELGAGLGHAAPLAAAARRAAAAGARVVLAFREPDAARLVAPGDGFSVVQAPAPETVPSRRGRRASGYADSLALYGFDDPDRLGPVIDAWQDLLAEHGADLLVADHAPGAALAARGRVPTVLIGGGFVLPPDHTDVFPMLDPEAEPAVPQGRLLERIDAVLHAKGRPRLGRLPAIVSARARLLRSIAWIDPYADIRRDAYLGPLEPMPEPSPRPEERSLYAYINASMPRFRQATAAFAAMNARKEAYVRGADAVMRRRLCDRGVALYDRPPPLGETVSGTRALLSNGTTNLCLAAVAAGRPVVAIPIHLNATIVARRLAQRAAFVLPEAAGGGPAIRRALERALSDPELDARAAQAAREAGPFDAEAALGEVERAMAAALAGQ